MKAMLLLSAAFISATLLTAQTAPQQRPVKTETESSHGSTQHQSTHSSTGATEHRSSASWHYHKGQKRPQVPVDGAPAARRKKSEDGVDTLR